MYNIEEYLQNKCDDYFAKVDVVIAREYAVDNRQKILKWPVYTKKNINWAVVRSTDIMAPGKMFVIRTLENESGKEIIAADDVYIMIGCMGEIYDISLEKFLKTYELTEEPLDVFDQMMTYIPEIKDGATGEYIAIDEVARICRPKSDTYIYVQKLNERTKIFNGDGKQGYFLGHKGDYMAARKDDLGDMYIINKDIFEKTYIRV
jgi:phosphoglycolate phosphatase